MYKFLSRLHCASCAFALLFFHPHVSKISQGSPCELFLLVPVRLSHLHQHTKFLDLSTAVRRNLRAFSQRCSFPPRPRLAPGLQQTAPWCRSQGRGRRYHLQVRLLLPSPSALPFARAAARILAPGTWLSSPFPVEYPSASWGSSDRAPRLTMTRRPAATAAAAAASDLAADVGALVAAHAGGGNPVS